MWKARFQEIYFAAHPVARLLFWVTLGGIASLGQAPFGWPIVSLLGFAAGFGSLALLFDDDMPGRKGWAFGLGYFLLTLQWLVSPFLVEPERHASRNAKAQKIANPLAMKNSAKGAIHAWRSGSTRNGLTSH